MVFHANSERVKKAVAAKEREDALQQALEAYQNEQAHSSQPRGLDHFANIFNVSSSTLGRRAKGGRSRAEYAASRQKLTVTQEDTLVKFIKDSADRGFPLNCDTIVLYATAILQRTTSSEEEELGDGWIFAFLDRKRDELQTHWSKPLDTQRARALNPESVAAWFKLVKEFIVDLNINPGDIYAMDESGFPPSHQGKERVVGTRGTKTQHKQGGASRENVTALVTICTDGSTLLPFIIFKGKNFMKKWGIDNVAKAMIGHSENGWTDGELALMWMIKIFDALTKEKAGGRTRVLLLDGHSSHYTQQLLHYARQNNITILGYPPHCTHALQGLDVVCFARMKEAWKEEINRFEKNQRRSITKDDFTPVFGTAFLRAFTPDLVKAAFEHTGVHPYDPMVITPEQMKPSLATSTKASFPLPQPSPVRKVMETFRANPPTRCDIDPDNLVAPSPSSTHCTPSRRPRDESATIDFTPSKRMRLLSASIGQTRSSYLVGGCPVTSANHPLPPVLETPPPLPEPDWSLLDLKKDDIRSQTRGQMLGLIQELTSSLQAAQQHIKARDLIIEGNHAQMIIQDMHLNAQNSVLEEREKKGTKKSDRTILFPQGMGRCLTSDEFTEAIEEQAAKVAEKAAAKEKRAEERAQKRSKKDLVEARWKAAMDAWNDEKEKHNLHCAGLLASGTRKSDLPKAPKRPLKKDIVAEVEGDMDGDESEDGEASDGEEEDC